MFYRTQAIALKRLSTLVSETWKMPARKGEMKRFFLFSGYTYYPAGGWKDFGGSFDTKEESVAAADEIHGWRQVVDSQTGEMVLDES